MSFSLGLTTSTSLTFLRFKNKVFFSLPDELPFLMWSTQHPPLKPLPSLLLLLLLLLSVICWSPMILCTSDSEQHNCLDESVENFVHSISTWRDKYYADRLQIRHVCFFNKQSTIVVLPFKKGILYQHFSF